MAASNKNDGSALHPDVSLLRIVNCEMLKRSLETSSGKKPFDLIMDGALMRPLDRLVQGASFFKNNGAQKIFKLEGTFDACFRAWTGIGLSNVISRCNFYLHRPCMI